jgi:uncharacterized YigZ family protein
MKVIASSPAGSLLCGEATLKIRRSTFIGYVTYCPSVDDVRALLAERCAIHSRATHNCWAYIVGYSGEDIHCSDAGEPSGSAGRPILNVLRSKDLTNVHAVVTRYYGGVKLGVRGLMDAYGEAVAAALETVSLKEYEREVSYSVVLDYPLLDTFLHAVHEFGCVEVSSDYGAAVSLIFKLAATREGEFEAYLATLKASRGLTYESLGDVK